MDPGWLLLWLSGVSAVLGLIRVLRSRPVPRGWLVAHVIVVLAAALSFAVAPEAGGWLTGALFGALLLLPAWAGARLHRALAARDFPRALRLARLLRWLHPADGQRDAPAQVRVLQAIHEGRGEQTRELLARHPELARSVEGGLRTLGLRVEARWEEALEGGGSLEDALLRLRARAELGDRDGTAAAFRDLDPQLAALRRDAERLAARLIVLASCGRAGAVERLVGGALSGLPPDVAVYWRAFAAQAAGEVEAARDAFARLAAAGSPMTRRAAARRLELPAPPPSAELLAVAAAIEREMDAERRFSLAPAAPRAAVTGLLLGFTGVVWLIEELIGSSVDLDTLYRMGAMVPAAVAAGEWWRVGSAMFLHFGVLHLGMNMLGLYRLGPVVEGMLGPARFLAVYLGSGLGSMLAVLALALGAGQATEMLVGASGAVLGLVGALAAVFLRGWLRERARVARQNLIWLLTVIAMQIAFDRLTPQVSGAAHLAGLVIGFALTWILGSAQKGWTSPSLPSAHTPRTW